ncbi:Mitochondrial phosphate carrier protein [Hondaea fermentalgiana]|uniref:Mitochondrial phosphate carrier protein n=1 Tax=Hondaea fermentalgiana TaxID=2315210 RepID=A0A2R5GCY7_9STRA|nr:Mitochondrial phosphate carrier protein [Hondaea fermentalgiana]|eukprot:GBG28840.1 Mitochondrial phosphate carrier protein [Hondaea fermentalgiana]
MFGPLGSMQARVAVEKEHKPVRAMSGADQGPFDLMYFLKGAFSGGVCCGITHGALCPVDVVKTRMQLEPTKYTGMISGFRKVIAEEGVGALATGLGPTAVGYFIQGWFKFGGVEFFKIQQASYFGVEKAWEYRFPIYLSSAAAAEFIADIFLCPLEATRIKLVSNPSYASGLISAFPKIIADEGFISGFYSGFIPILFKQVPYTMAKFAVQGAAQEKICDMTSIDLTTAPESTKVSVSLASGVIAGVAAAIISHPADTLLSVINKPGAGGKGTMFVRLGRVAAELGFVKLCLTGLPARCIMIGTLTAGQFGIFDTVMAFTGASKFHFTDPAELEHK